MLNSTTTLDHPVLRCARVLAAALDEVSEVDPAFMPTDAKATALRELARVADRVRGMVLRVLANAEDVALDHGARSAAAWLAHETRSGYAAAAAAGRLAEALDNRWGQVRSALLAGTINAEQARVVAHALDELPDDLDPELLVKAEAHLVAEAAHFEPGRLRILGRKVLEVIAPDVFDDHERKALEDEGRRARQSTRLTMHRRGDGTTDIAIRVADAVASRFTTYLEAYAAPRRGHLDAAATHTDPETGRRISHAELQGHAFCSILEAIPASRLPRHGGAATTVVVTVDLDDLLRGVGVADLLDGQPVSVDEAMRLACNADLVPLVLGGDGQPLHLGRTSRLFSPHQRLAMAVRDRRCRAHGCTVPAAWTEAHHLRPWSKGGRTDLEDGILLCSFHHHRAHDPEHVLDVRGGQVQFHRRT